MRQTPFAFAILISNRVERCSHLPTSSPILPFNLRRAKLTQVLPTSTQHVCQRNATDLECLQQLQVFMERTSGFTDTTPSCLPLPLHLDCSSHRHNSRSMWWLNSDDFTHRFAMRELRLANRHEHFPNPPRLPSRLSTASLPYLPIPVYFDKRRILELAWDCFS